MVRTLQLPELPTVQTKAKPWRLPTPHRDSPALWEVAVALPLFQTLTYRLPPALTAAARVGSLVRVPVGRRQVTGYLLAPAREAPPGRLRDIQAVLDPVPRFGPEMVPLFRWVADYYQYPLGEALSHIIPGGRRPTGPAPGTAGRPPGPRRTPPRPRAWGPNPGPPGLSGGKRPHRGQRPPGPLPRLPRPPQAPGGPGLDKPGGPHPPRGPPGRAALALEEPDLTLVPGTGRGPGGHRPGDCTGRVRPFLLHGVTASGKTEVYLSAARRPWPGAARCWCCCRRSP